MCELCVCSWLARTDPRDVARVESKTVIVTAERRDTVPSRRDGGVSQLGRWMSPEEWDKAMNLRFPGCMKGREAADAQAAVILCRHVMLRACVCVCVQVV